MPLSGAVLPLRTGHRAAYWALAAVCLFWGTTYLGIRIALESFPPFTLVALRFICSGSLLLLGARLLGYELPHGRQWLESTAHGCLTVGVGTGCLVLAETHIVSSLAALFVAVGPFWNVGIEALMPGGERLHKPAIAGMLVGLAGVLILVVPDALRDGFQGPVLLGFGIIQIGACGWAIGSSLLRQHQTRANPIVSGGVQQLGAGLVFLLPAWIETHWFAAPVHWDTQGISAIAYLVVFGSIVGYSAYVYSLSHLPVAMVSIYNYVNPMVAAGLGWLFYRERFGRREFSALVVILVGVGLVKWATAQKVPRA
jgi:drug/metabolite transporter (DMT)-like permease